MDVVDKVKINKQKHCKHVETPWHGDRKHTRYGVSGHAHLTHPVVSANYITWNSVERFTTFVLSCLKKIRTKVLNKPGKTVLRKADSL